MYLYRDSNSIFHRLHPVSKFLLLAALIAVSLLNSRLPDMLIVFCIDLAFLLIAGGGGNLKKFWKLMLIFWIFTFVIWIVIPHLRGVAWTIENAAMLATRIDSFVLCGLLFVTTTRIEEFTMAMTRMGVPYRAAFALSLGFRLVPLFYQNLQTIVSAQKSRGVDLDSGGLLSRTRRYVPILGVLISYGIRNADLMAMSLEARGFGYSSTRTSYLQPHPGGLDLIILLPAAAAIALLVLR